MYTLKQNLLKQNSLSKDKNEYSQEDFASFISFDDNLNALQSSFEIPNVPNTMDDFNENPGSPGIDQLWGKRAAHSSWLTP